MNVSGNFLAIKCSDQEQEKFFARISLLYEDVPSKGQMESGAASGCLESRAAPIPALAGGSDLLWRLLLLRH